MKRAIYPALLLMIFFAASPVFGQSKVLSQDELLEVLSGYHDIPGAQYWSQLEPAYTRNGLMNIADSASVPTPMRARALQALTYFQNDAVTDHLASTAQNESMPYLRAAAYSALSQVGDSSEGVKVLKSALGDSDVMVRLTAARALRSIQTTDAADAIEEGLAGEANATAKSVMMNILKQMRE